MIIDVSKSVTSRLPLEPVKDNGVWKNNGLIIGRLVNIFMTTEEYKKGEYAGHTLPVLNFEFQNYKVLPSDPDRFYVHREKPVGTLETKEGNYVPRDAKKIENDTNNLWGRIKHILDACKVLPTSIFRDIAMVPAEDITANFDLPIGGTPEERIAAFGKFFNYICDFANGNGTTIPPMYREATGEGCLVWLKLLPDYSEGKKYEFPTFTRTGFIEGTRIDTTTKLPIPAKILQIRPNESLELTVAGVKNTADATPGMPSGDNSAALDYLRQKVS